MRLDKHKAIRDGNKHGDIHIAKNTKLRNFLNEHWRK